MGRIPGVRVLFVAGLLAAAALGPRAGQTASAGRFTVGLVLFSATDTFSHRVQLGFEQAARAKGWATTVIDSNGSADQGNSAIQNLVQRKVNGIIVNVFPSTSMALGLAAARRAHIPVISQGGGLANGVAASVDVNGADVITQRMARDMGGKGSVLAFTYHTGAPCRLRERYFDSVVSKYPGIKVTKNEVQVPGFVQSGSQYATAWLANHQAGSGNLAIWGCWDGPDIGAISALRQNGRTDAKVYGFNGDADALQAIKSGTMTASMYFDPIAQGKQVVGVLSQVIAQGPRWAPRTVYAEQIVVDQKNINAFLKQHPEALHG